MKHPTNVGITAVTNGLGGRVSLCVTQQRFTLNGLLAGCRFSSHQTVSPKGTDGFFERPIGRVSLHLLSVLANGDYKAIIRLSNGGNLMITPLREAQSLGGQKRLGETLAV